MIMRSQEDWGISEDGGPSSQEKHNNKAEQELRLARMFRLEDRQRKELAGCTGGKRGFDEMRSR